MFHRVWRWLKRLLRRWLGGRRAVRPKPLPEPTAVPDETQTLLAQGIQYLQDNQYESALTCLEQAATLNPVNADTWYQMGTVLQKLGRYAEAIQANEKANLFLKRTDPKKENLVRGTSQFNIGSSFTPKITQSEQQAEAFLEKGNRLFEVGDFLGSIASYDQALQLKPDSHEPGSTGALPCPT